MRTALLGLLALALIAPPAAAADGLPVTGLDGSAGVLSPDGQYRTVTFISGRHTTVARIHVRGGVVARYRTLPGWLAIPAVAYDQSMSGVSADGRTLALIRPRVQIPERTTRIVLLDAQRFLPKRTIVLRGDFSFDAISPDGSRLYLIQYAALSRHNFDPTKYAVRSLDAASGKLDRAPIVDPREPDEKMGGLPVTRAMSPDGRWAYTLYSGNEHPFVHALDTVGGTARCVDLDALTKRNDIFQMKLRVASTGRDLQVTRDGKPVSLIDTSSFKVSLPRPASAAPHLPPVSHDSGPPAWPWIVAGVALLLLLAATARPLARATRAR
jgi:hypothetical protein